MQMKKKVPLAGIMSLSLLMSACGAEHSIQEVEEEKEIKGLGWTHSHPAAPTAGEWEAVELPDGRSYTLDPPPENDSDTTKKDLKELRMLAEKRTEENIQIIKRWSSETTGPNSNWVAITEETLGKYSLAPPEAAKVHQVVSGAIYTASVAAFNQKYLYLRPRPTDLDPDIKLIENFEVPAHPSYPSAHTTTSWAASTVLAYMFPNEKESFLAMANEADLSRKLAGVHYESDNIAGRKLGKQIAEDIIKGLQDDEAPLVYEVPEQAGH